MEIKEFDRSYMEEAKRIARSEYEEERKRLPFLPELAIPDLSHFAENGLGVAAFEGNHMLGFLGAYAPINDAFGTTNVKGTFSPIHAHGVLSQNLFHEYYGSVSRYSRDRLYSILYQAAAEKWVRAGILSHAVALFEQDREGINSFFHNGFGLRCIDAVRSLEQIPESIGLNQSIDDIVYEELPGEEWVKLLSLNNGLIAHLGKSPTFMPYDYLNDFAFKHKNSEDTRYFAAKTGKEYVAYIKLSDNGENYITESGNMKNISGAFCNPKYRGTGLYHNLLMFLMTVLKSEGYELLGVDFESINPTARGFWLKYFTAYTQSVVRRIDDKAVDC